MRLALLLTALLAFPSVTAFAEDVSPKTMAILAEENRVALEDAKVIPTAFAYVESKLAPHFGVFGFILGTRAYAEAYAGPMLFLGPFSLGIGAGYEQADKPWRIALSSSLMLEKFHCLLMAEHGGSGPWVRTIVTGIPMPYLGIGALAETRRGIGPYVDVKPLPATLPLSIYAAIPFGPLNPQGTFIFGTRLYL